MRKDDRIIPEKLIDYLLRVILDEAALIEASSLKPKFISQPFKLPTSCHFIEPVLRHHAEHRGLDASDIFSTEHYQLRPQSFQKLFKNDLLRKKVIQDFVEHVNPALTDKPVAIKGFNIAKYYPASSLREMEDVDLICQATDQQKLREAIRQIEWKAINPSTLKSKDGVLLELLNAKTDFAKRVIDQAIEYKNENIKHPRPHHAFMILALHASKHRGTRIWRDVCDSLMLLSKVEDHEKFDKDLMKEMKFVSKSQRYRILAFSSFLKVEIAKYRIQVFVNMKFQKQSALQEHYHRMLRLDISEAEFMVLDNLFQNPLKLFRKKSITKRTTSSSTGQRDIKVGELSQPGSLSRLYEKLSIGCSVITEISPIRLYELIRAGRLSRKHSKTFDNHLLK